MVVGGPAVDLIVGIVLIAIAVFLIYIGRPNKSGQHLRFLRFDAMVVLYPPVILVFAVLGGAEIITMLAGIQR
jgi:ABC-type transport system involved in multi-copper enzyme maturation permease subunit